MFLPKTSYDYTYDLYDHKTTINITSKNILIVINATNYFNQWALLIEIVIPIFIDYNASSSSSST
jgi:hypothetical protein